MEEAIVCGGVEDDRVEVADPRSREHPFLIAEKTLFHSKAEKEEDDREAKKEGER